MSLRTILVPTDFSAPSRLALPLAAEIARRTRASLMLAYMDSAPNYSVVAGEQIYLPPPLIEGLRRSRTEHFEQQLNELARSLPADVPRSIQVQQSDVVGGVIDTAAQENSDLIVMGSHGRGASRFLLGSVAAKVSRSAPCPVLVVRANARNVPAPGFERALVAVDYSPFSRLAARFASQLVSDGGVMELLHVWDDSLAHRDELFQVGHEVAESIEAARRYHAMTLDEFAADLRSACNVRSYLATGNIPRAILERASEIEADLVVVGAHARPHLEQRILGTSADNVLRHAECPVLVIPDTALQLGYSARASSRPESRSTV